MIASLYRQSYRCYEKHWGKKKIMSAKTDAIVLNFEVVYTKNKSSSCRNSISIICSRSIGSGSNSGGRSSIGSGSNSGGIVVLVVVVIVAL